jgi:dTDP-4-dehydro-6-deoxy-alpha-D-glucopyranose 2,3-dehydratase
MFRIIDGAVGKFAGQSAAAHGAFALDELPGFSGRQPGVALDMSATLSWLTEHCANHAITAELIPLKKVTGWVRTDDEIRHEDGRHFGVIGVSVSSTTREIASWTQPMIRPVERGIVALIIKREGDNTSALIRARAEPGFIDAVEIGPSVQYQPSSYAAGAAPLFADLVRNAPQDTVLYDTILSEEGGRFYHPENRYMIIEVADDFVEDPPPDYRWLPARELSELVMHRNYVNVQARTLVAVLRLTLGLP